MKKLFKEIQERLVSLSSEPPKGNALKRINNLSGFVSGMIRKGSSHLPDIGSGLPKDIDANSKTAAAKRFVASEWIDFETHFLPFLTAFIQGIFAFTLPLGGIVLVIDGSQTGKDNATLMISLVWQNRGIPICWFVKSGGKGHFKSEDHEALLKYAIQVLNPLLPDNIPVRWSKKSGHENKLNSCSDERRKYIKKASSIRCGIQEKYFKNDRGWS